MERKELTKGEMEMAKQLSEMIEKLDKVVFPGNPIEVLVVKDYPERENERFRYVDKCCIAESEGGEISKEGEHYIIYGFGLDQRIGQEKRKRIMLFKDSEMSKNSKDLPLLSLGEVLVAIASHEVRHRFQNHFPNDLFSPGDVGRTNDPYLKRLTEYTTLLCKGISPKHYEIEIDAGLIEHWVTEKWHWGERDLSQIAKIVKSKPIPNKKELSSLFFYEIFN